MRRGTFIVLEGVEGSGKATQLQRLGDRLSTLGYDVVFIDFPQYSSGSSYFIKEYLSGAYGQPDAVGPYTAALFYALDRYEASTRINQALAEGKIVLANRFTGSNMGYQGTKFSHPEERRGFFIWLDNLEFQMLGIPRPDISFVLKVPAGVALQQIEQSAAQNPARKFDTPENKIALLQRAVEVYDDLCQLFPKDFVRVDCLRHDKLLSIEDVANILWGKVEPLLPTTVEKPVVPASNLSPDTRGFYVPDKLEPAIRQKYILTMGELEEIRSHLQATLGDTPGAAEVLQATLSLATLDQAGQPLLGLPTQTSPVKSLADAQLPANHTAQTEHVHLVQYTPRNELDLVPEMLYEFSDQPLAEIQRVAGNWNYDQKAAMVQAYIKQHQAALTKASYSWDIVSDFVTMQAVERHLGITVDKQMASPRLGYDVPAPIEAAGFSDDFEHCFELSLELYSQLQAAGYTTEASYAVLAGHRLRWKASINLVQMAMLADAMADNQIIRQMADKVSEAHPLIAERLKSSTAISTHVTAPLHDSPTAIS